MQGRQTGSQKRKVGTKISIDLGGEKMPCTIQRIEEGAALLFSDRLAFYSTFNQKASSGKDFPNSDLCKYLNGIYLDSLPKKTKELLVPLENKDQFFRIPFRSEIYGESSYYDCGAHTQLAWQQDPAHRILGSGHIEGYWLDGVYTEYPQSRPIALTNGRTLNAQETTENGVRLVFAVKFLA